MITLENDLIKATFSKDTGVLLEMESKKTGWKIQRRPELALSFRLIVPLPNRRNNPVLGEKQKLTKFRKSENGKQVIFLWDSLQSEYGGKLNISVKGVVTLDNAGLTFEGEIENRSPYVVESVSYPCVGDVSIPLTTNFCTKIF